MAYGFGEVLWPAPEPVPAPIVVRADHVAEAANDWLRATGRAPSDAELDRLIADIVDEELLFRAALKRGFQDDDGVVARRMIANQRFVENAGTGAEALADEALLEAARSLGMEQTDLVVRRRLVERIRDEIVTAAGARETASATGSRETRAATRDVPRVRGVHVFLSADSRADRLPADARALRERLVRERLTSDDAVALALGDPLLVPARLPLTSQRELAARLGTAFAADAFALPIRRWSEPLTSSYGTHLVWIDERVESGSRSTEEPAWESPTDRTAGDRAAVRAALALLRQDVEILVEHTDPPATR